MFSNRYLRNYLSSDRQCRMSITIKLPMWNCILDDGRHLRAYQREVANAHTKNIGSKGDPARQRPLRLTKGQTPPCKLLVLPGQR
jgi:hypothetical protein